MLQMNNCLSSDFSDFLPANIALYESLPVIPEQTGFLRSITLGYQVGAVFFTAFHQGLLTDLLIPKTLVYLSGKYGIPPEKLTLILGMLVSGNILRVGNGEYWVRKELKPFLDPDSPVYARWLHSECKNRHYWDNLDYFLKYPGYHDSKYDSNGELKRDEIVSMGVQSLLGRLQGIVKVLQEYPGFASSRSLLDLGGGHGFIGIACAQANPGMKVVIYDKPSIVRIAWEHVCLSGVEDRVVCIGGDYSQGFIGTGYDFILHICPTDFPPDMDRQVIRIIHAALSSKGVYVRCGFFLDDNCTGPLITTSFALAAEMRGEKRHRTIREFQQMVNETGLDLVKTIDMSPYCEVPMYLMICK